MDEESSTKYPIEAYVVWCDLPDSVRSTLEFLSTERDVYCGLHKAKDGNDRPSNMDHFIKFGSITETKKHGKETEFLREIMLNLEFDYKDNHFWQNKGDRLLCISYSKLEKKGDQHKPLHLKIIDVSKPTILPATETVYSISSIYCRPIEIYANEVLPREITRRE